VRYDAPVDSSNLDEGRFVAVCVGGERIRARACVLSVSVAGLNARI